VGAGMLHLHKAPFNPFTMMDERHMAKEKLRVEI
jgi:hypothetical protein